MRKMGAVGFFREELEPNREIRDEIADACIRANRTLRGQAIRFSFFRAEPEAGCVSAARGEDFLGYLVWLRFWEEKPKRRNSAFAEFVLESVVRSPSLVIPAVNGASERPVSLPNFYLHCVRQWDSTIGTRACSTNLEIIGSFFCQQSGFTHVCAHAALRMAWNNTERLIQREKLTNRRINKLLRIDHSDPRKRRGSLPGAKSKPTGLSEGEIRFVIQALGADFQTANFRDEPNLNYEHVVYPLVESGCPVILGIYGPGTTHVVTVVGHTRNSDRWSPEARHGYDGGALQLSPYMSAVEWADHLIAHDDNFGASLSIPTDSLKSVLLPAHNAGLHACIAIAIVPKGVSFSCYKAETIAAGTAQMLLEGVAGISGLPKNRWRKRLCDNFRDQESGSHCERMICRTILQSRSDYIGHFSEHCLCSSAELEFLRAALPVRFWVTELSIPPIYTANRHKLGDVIVRCGKNSSASRDRVPFAWFPGVAVFGDALFQWSIEKHIPLLRAGHTPCDGMEW